jgi:hypothetical protein
VAGTTFEIRLSAQILEKKGGDKSFAFLLNGTPTFYLNRPDLNLFLTASIDSIASLAVEVSDFLSLIRIL